VIVLDSNILIRAVLGHRVRWLLEEYAGRGIRFYAPDAAFDDAQRYLPTLLEKRGKSTADVSAMLMYLQTLIEPADLET
jgi:predicted nucleic acid-binding protein